MKSWDVTAEAFDRVTGISVAKQRTELVDSDNLLFSKCHSILDVKNAYERFWNELNPKAVHVVFVSKVIPIQADRK